MSTIRYPSCLSRCRVRNRLSTSAGVSTAVGSSRISTRASPANALRISTRCWAPTDRVATGAPGSATAIPYWAASSRTRWASTSRRTTSRLLPGRASSIFSATVRVGTSMKCWWTMAMPAASAARGERKTCGRPSSCISPASGRYSPDSSCIRVDLPAPFSPNRAWISPPWKSTLTRSTARTPGKALLISRTDTSGIS